MNNHKLLTDMKKTLPSMLSLALALCIALPASAKIYSVTSPDGKLKSEINAGAELSYNIVFDGREILAPSKVALALDNGKVWGTDVKVRKAARTGVDRIIDTPIYRASEIRESYNALTLTVAGGYSVEFRVYNDGVAYRFVNHNKQPFCIMNEQADYRFADDYTATVPYVRANGDMERQLANSFENIYTTMPLSQLDSQKLAFLPLLVDAGEGVKVCITETNLEAYPGMYLYNPNGGKQLTAHFARYPKKEEIGGYLNIQLKVKEREEYIAKVDAPRAFPWRIAVVGNDVEVAASDLGYLLAEESRIADISWIRPGKVAWYWWNAWNIEGVDFKSGINTDTYKFYIDFASKYGVEYVIMDDGWTMNNDLLQVIPEIDMPGLVDYAASKGVGIILWAGYVPFVSNMENVCKHYSEMGVKGFKVDFMDRDDQLMTAFNYLAAAMAAKYHLVLDLHGTHKPAGLTRTYPNILNVEGVHGLEQMKWSPKSVDQTAYDVLIPFIRQVSGPMDYTQGAMRNATKWNYYPCSSEPMSQGTRCHQLALYMVLDSPLNMLCDSPTNYMKEDECTRFIASVPTVWDETRVLDGKMGEYVVTARRSGNIWYVGGITNWTERDIEIDLSSLLGEGEHELILFRDGVNAHRKATDYKRVVSCVSAKESLKVHLAPGGGFATQIKSVE